MKKKTIFTLKKKRMNSTKKLVVILGPTACGKTSLSLEIAKKLNTEIISCDSRQFYKELKIGSAPPTVDEQKLVKHHFIQHLSINQDYSIGQYENDAIKKISQLFDKYDYLILVGGSGLYIDAICNGVDKIPNVNKEIRERINEEFDFEEIVITAETVSTIPDSLFEIAKTGRGNEEDFKIEIKHVIESHLDGETAEQTKIILSDIFEEALSYQDPIIAFGVLLTCNEIDEEIFQNEKISNFGNYETISLQKFAKEYRNEILTEGNMLKLNWSHKIMTF